MEEPDYDDLIEDYVEEYEEPVDYDEEAYFEEEAMAAEANNSSTTAAGPAASTTAPATTTVTTTNPVTAGMDTTQQRQVIGQTGSTQQEETMEANEEDSSNIRNSMTRRTDEGHLYNFERYKKTAKWRTESKDPHSNDSEAKGWKTSKSDLFTSSSLYLKQNKKKSKSPETQLLDLMHQRGSKAVPSMRLLQTLASPSKGASTVPMTLADGTRTYVRLRPPPVPSKNCESSSNNNNNKSSTTSSLGVSMNELKRRADRIRRMQGTEHNPLARPVAGGIGSGQLWVDKHAPKSFPHLLSDERTNREVLRALRAWDPYVFGREPPPRPTPFYNNNNDQEDGKNSNAREKNPNDKRPDEQNRVLLLSGPPGVGKSTMAHIIARHAGYRPLEVNGSDERSASVLTDRVRRAMESNTMKLSTDDTDHGRPNCLILDEIDGADAKGAIQAIVEIIKAEIPPKNAKKKAPYLRRPIIFICNHKYASALRPLLPYAKHFNVDSPSPTRLVARLKAILSQEKLSMMSGGSLLHQLVVSSGGDIRSCLYTLQFASSQAEDINSFQQALRLSLGGLGLKDNRNDIASTITTVFRRIKASRIGNFTTRGDDRASVNRVLDAVESLGDNSATVNALFMNILRVSYIDPTLDRCSVAHEWLSGADLFRSSKVSSHDSMAQYGMQKLHTPSVAAAIHLLCRVEMKSNLNFSTREMSDAHFQRETNLGLVQKFAEGLPPSSRTFKCQNLLPLELAPSVLWILSAGEGNSALCRAASSVDVLTKLERASVMAHVSVLKALGLTYVSDLDVQQQQQPGGKFNSFKDNSVYKMRLEPPIDRLVSFVHFQMPAGLRRKWIPNPMKELIAQQVRLENFRKSESSSTPIKASARPEKAIKTPLMDKRLSPSSSSSSNNIPKKEVTPRKLEDLVKEAIAPNKRSKPSPTSTATNFLGIGAKKAKAAKSARNAAAVGLGMSSNKKIKYSHTGSGLPLNQVIRLRHVKGFTQAVRTPAQIQDLE